MVKNRYLYRIFPNFYKWDYLGPATIYADALSIWTRSKYHSSRNQFQCCWSTYAYCIQSIFSLVSWRPTASLWPPTQAFLGELVFPTMKNDRLASLMLEGSSWKMELQWAILPTFWQFVYSTSVDTFVKIEIGLVENWEVSNFEFHAWYRGDPWLVQKCTNKLNF